MVSGVLYIFGFLSADYYEEESRSEIDDFARSITKEAEILQKVEPGYSREMMIPNYLTQRYNISLTGDYLIVTPQENGSRVRELNASRRFYTIAGETDVSLYRADHNGDGLNETYVVLRKPDTPSKEGIVLD